MNFALINESTEPSLTAAVVASMAAAVQAQLHTDYASLWQAAPVDVYVVGHELDAHPLDALIVLLDNADQAGALGYHDTTPAGRPYARIFVETILGSGGTLTTGANSVSVCISHEALETLGDPYCNAYVDAADGAQYALELADPVESSSYELLGVAVSNFVGPRWFDPQATEGPFDQLGTLTKPFQVAPDGYVISRKPGGPATSTFGERFPSWKLWKRATPRPGCRPHKRGSSPA